jgi:hypothetical protein
VEKIIPDVGCGFDNSKDTDVTAYSDHWTTKVSRPSSLLPFTNVIVAEIEGVSKYYMQLSTVDKVHRLPTRWRYKDIRLVFIDSFQ